MTHGELKRDLPKSGIKQDIDYTIVLLKGRLNNGNIDGEVCSVNETWIRSGAWTEMYSSEGQREALFSYQRRL